jgi:hypothetical protein
MRLSISAATARTTESPSRATLTRARTYTPSNEAPPLPPTG